MYAYIHSIIHTYTHNYIYAYIQVCVYVGHGFSLFENGNANLRTTMNVCTKAMEGCRSTTPQ